MKTKITFTILLLTTFLVGDVHADGPTITAANVAGEVTIVRGESVIPVTEGTKFLESDQVITGEGAAVDVVWKDKWGYRLLSKSDCQLLSTEKSRSKVMMNAGDIIVNMKKIDEDTGFQLETPVLVVGVRGTQFWGRVDNLTATTPTTVAVREGEVEITAKKLGQTIAVKAGEAVDLTMDSAALEKRAAKSGEMAAMALAEEIPV